MRKAVLIAGIFVLMVLISGIPEAKAQRAAKNPSKELQKVKGPSTQLTKKERLPSNKTATVGSSQKSVQFTKSTKNAWIASHPQEYKAMCSNSVKISISKQDLDKLPAERSAYIKNHSEKYEIK